MGNIKILHGIYSIPKLHKNPYKFRFIVGSKLYSEKEWSVLSTKILHKRYTNFAVRLKLHQELLLFDFAGLQNNILRTVEYFTR